ncbi:AMP-binding protein [Thermoactinomyces mirandus]|uniref:AMP-binding protein n=1 Tax=Thermoactinomyces mirandus TaxID=2756294 RepID=UPI001C693597|nr:AMP-binding protein [Thermoactinomyces mirandus]
MMQFQITPIKWQLLTAQADTYRELGKLVDRVALGLLRIGLKKGDVISIQLPNWNEFVILHYAATRIGAITNL